MRWGNVRFSIQKKIAHTLAWRSAKRAESKGKENEENLRHRRKKIANVAHFLY